MRIPVVLNEKVEKYCHRAFSFASNENDSQVIVDICYDSEDVPLYYKTTVNMPVCDDTLCANVVLKLYWDLAGNYLKFDTIPGFPLTKFDHKKFTSADYKKLDEILQNRNSILRVMHKNELVDKSVTIKATTVDAVTGATPQTIKNAVVEGAVYSSYTLWYFVNGSVTDSMKSHTEQIWSAPVSILMLRSANYETQLFALKRWSDADYELHSELFFELIKKSVPLVRAYALSKVSLPFDLKENNRRLVDLLPFFDGYSKSIFLERVVSERKSAIVLIPLLNVEKASLNEKQRKRMEKACYDFGITTKEENR